MPISFAHTAQLWLAEVKPTLRPQTHWLYTRAVAMLLERVPELEHRPVSRPQLIAFRNARAAEVSIHTANRDMRAFRACLRWAWLNELDHPNVPLGRLMLPLPPPREQALTPDEIARVFDAAAFDPQVLVLLKICHATGFRRGEALSLEWRDVDLERGTLTVSPKAGWEAKTDASYRTVHAPQLCAWLATYREALRKRGPHDPVCQRNTARGLAWSPTSSRLHVRLRRVYDRAGVRDKKPTHGFRHAMGHDLAQSGAPIHVAQRILGHASPAMTLGVYARARAEGVEAAGLELERWRRG